MYYGLRSVKVLWHRQGLGISDSLAYCRGRAILTESAGRVLELSPQTGEILRASEGAGRIFHLACCDVDGDKRDECFVLSEGGLFELRHGALHPVSQTFIPVRAWCYDADGDGKGEITVADSSATLNVFKAGKPFLRIPVEPPILFFSVVETAGSTSFVILYSTGIYERVRFPDGKLMAHKEFFLGEFRRARLGDIDGDGSPEVILATGRLMRALRLTTDALEDLIEFPYPVADFVVADINEDGEAEIAVLLEKGRNVASLSVFSREWEPLLDVDAGGSSKLYVADLNADGIPELVAVDPHGEVLVADEAGVLERHKLPSEILRCICADVDNDGLHEIVLRLKDGVTVLKRF